MLTWDSSQIYRACLYSVSLPVILAVFPLGEILQAGVCVQREIREVQKQLSRSDFGFNGRTLQHVFNIDHGYSLLLSIGVHLPSFAGTLSWFGPNNVSGILRCLWKD